MKKTKDLFNESYKSLKRESKEDITRWKDLLFSWIDRLNIVKMAILSKSNLCVQCCPYQNFNGILHREKNQS
jgi:hypothetical protein